MENLFRVLIVFFAFSSLICFGQDTPQTKENKWTRIETENKELAVSFPSDFLIDEKTRTFNQRYRVFGFEDGVSMKMEISRPEDPKKYLEQITVEPSDTLKLYSISVSGFAGKNVVNRKNRYSNTIFLASKDTFYDLSISAPNENKVEIERFLCSVMLNGNPLFICKKSFPELNNETVSLSSLKTSPKVLEALKREMGSKEGKIIYKLEADYNDVDASDEDSTKRPAIIIYRGLPSAGYSIGQSDIRRPREKFIIKLRVTLLASGQIGDVTAFSKVTVDKSIVRNFVDAAKRTKFIPAEINGKPVDSQQTLFYSFTNY